MSQQYRLLAQPRTLTGKQVKQLRKEGLTPIVVYGRKSEPISLQTETKALVKVLGQAGGTQLIGIEVDGESAPRMTLAKDVQRHVTKLYPIHADFLQVVMDEEIVQEVPLHVVGEPAVVRNTEAMLGIELDRVSVRALPANLPPFIEVDAAQMEEVGDALFVGDVEVSEELEIVSDPGLLVARVYVPAVQVEEEEEAAEELLEEMELGEAGEVAGGEAEDEDSEG